MFRHATPATFKPGWDRASTLAETFRNTLTPPLNTVLPRSERGLKLSALGMADLRGLLECASKIRRRDSGCNNKVSRLVLEHRLEPTGRSWRAPAFQGRQTSNCESHARSPRGYHRRIFVRPMPRKAV